MDFGKILFDLIRIIHIVSAVFWVGFVGFSAFVLEPAVKAAGAQGEVITRGLFRNGRYVMLMAAAGGIAVLAGIVLFIMDRATGSFTSRTQEIIFSIGGLFGIIGAIVNGAGLGRAAREMVAAGKKVEDSGSKPSANLMAEYQAAQAKMFRFSRWTTYVVVLALLLMVIAGSL